MSLEGSPAGRDVGVGARQELASLSFRGTKLQGEPQTSASVTKRQKCHLAFPCAVPLPDACPLGRGPQRAQRAVNPTLSMGSTSPWPCCRSSRSLGQLTPGGTFWSSLCLRSRRLWPLVAAELTLVWAERKCWVSKPSMWLERSADPLNTACAPPHLQPWAVAASVTSARPANQKWPPGHVTLRPSNGSAAAG